MPTPDPLKPYRLYIAMFVLNLAVVAGVIYLLRREEPRPVLITTPTPKQASAGSQKSQTSFQVVVQGAVNQPGTVQLDADARMADALQKAGGVKPEADLSKINLTLALNEGDQIHVPLRATSALLDTNLAPTVSNPTLAPSLSPTAPPSTLSAKLNLNAATLEELDKLPGIGPALAQRILDYRTEHGGFKSVEELKNVRGIGDKLYDEIKDLVTVQ